jgi:hypothetical protein
LNDVIIKNNLCINNNLNINNLSILSKLNLSDTTFFGNNIFNNMNINNLLISNISILNNSIFNNNLTINSSLFVLGSNILKNAFLYKNTNIINLNNNNTIINGNSTFYSNLNIKNNCTINKNITICSNMFINNNSILYNELQGITSNINNLLTINLSLNSNLFVSKNIIFNNIYNNNNSSFLSNFYSLYNSKIYNNIQFNKLLSLESNTLKISGTTIFQNTILNNISLLSNLYISGNAYFNNSLLLNNLTVNSILNISSNSILQGTVSINTDLNISNNAIINNNLSCMSLFYISGISNLQNTIFNNITINSNLNISNISLFKNILINMNTSTYSDITINANAKILGSITYLSNLNISGISTINQSQIFNSDLTFKSSFYITKTSIINVMSANSSLFISNNTNLNNTIFNNLNCSSIYLTNNSILNNVSMKSNLNVTNLISSSINFNNLPIFTNITTAEASITKFYTLFNLNNQLAIRIYRFPPTLSFTDYLGSLTITISLSTSYNIYSNVLISGSPQLTYNLTASNVNITYTTESNINSFPITTPIDGILNTSVARIYVISYQITDIFYNRAVLTRTVNISPYQIITFSNNMNNIISRLSTNIVYYSPNSRVLLNSNPANLSIKNSYMLPDYTINSNDWFYFNNLITSNNNYQTFSLILKCQISNQSSDLILTHALQSLSIGILDNTYLNITAYISYQISQGIFPINDPGFKWSKSTNISPTVGYNIASQYALITGCYIILRYSSGIITFEIWDKIWTSSSSALMIAYSNSSAVPGFMPHQNNAALITLKLFQANFCYLYSGILIDPITTTISIEKYINTFGNNWPVL